MEKINKKRLKISVVLCTYNGAKYLEKQLNSIFNQTITPDEIVITDDCSIDSTINILEKYKKKYSCIKLIKNTSNKGFVDNFKYAISLTTGDIIFFCDQDDIWYKNKVEKMLNLFIKNNNILSLNCNYDLINENDELINSIYKIIHTKKSLKKIKFKQFIVSPRYPGMSMAIRKELKEKCDFNKVNLSSHDWFFNQLASYYDGCFYTSYKLNAYRQHDNNTVGIVKSTNREYLKQQRIERINSFKIKHHILKELYNDDKNVVTFSEKLINIDEMRLKCITRNLLCAYLKLYLMNFRYISFRCFIGDLLSIIKNKF